MTPIHLFESSLSRVREHQLNHDSGIISAFRYAPNCGAGEPYTKSDNKKRNKVLKASLYKLGYGVTNVDGTYVENFATDKQKSEHLAKMKLDPKLEPLPTPHDMDEDSFLVVDLKDTGKLRQDLKKLGLKWDQDSILFIPAGSKKDGVLIGTNKCPLDFIRFNQVLPQGGAVFGADGMFKSKVNGRSFTLRESNEEHLTSIPRSNHSKWLNSCLAKSDWETLSD